MAKTPATVDFGDEFAVDDTPVPFVLVKNIFGEDFRVLQEVNLFAAMGVAGEDPALSDLQKMIINLIHPEDRVRFRNLVARQSNLSGEKLGLLIERLMGVASGGRPTGSSSGSARTTRTKAVGRGSAGALSAG